jgi:coenzyme F420-reducing hydrogenase beta subunit
MTSSAASVSPVQGGVADVLGAGLCVGCGACCVADGSVSMAMDRQGRLLPDRIPGAAADAVCPFSDLAPDEDAIAHDLGLDLLPRDDRLGHLHSTWAGFVVEGDYREKASSGGLTSWLIVELLRTTRATAAIHVHAGEGSDARLFEFSVSRSEGEVRTNSKTRYYPVSFDRAIAEARAADQPFIFVGVPCHVKALGALCRQDPRLADLVVARIALFCGHMKSAGFAHSLAAQLGVARDDIRTLDFRLKLPDRKASDYGVAVTARDGRRVERPMAGLAGRDWGRGYFRLEACNYCDDVAGETADISLGDAWLPEYVDDAAGTNVVVSRRADLTALLQAAHDAGRIRLDPLAPDRVAASQAAGFRDRRDGLRYRLWIAGRRGRWAPRKRVRPERAHLSLLRRAELRLRTATARRSHGSWRLAENNLLALYRIESRFWGLLIQTVQRLERRTRRRANERN